MNCITLLQLHILITIHLDDFKLVCEFYVLNVRAVHYISSFCLLCSSTVVHYKCILSVNKFCLNRKLPQAKFMHFVISKKLCNLRKATNRLKSFCLQGECSFQFECMSSEHLLLSIIMYISSSLRIQIA